MERETIILEDTLDNRFLLTTLVSNDEYDSVLSTIVEFDFEKCSATYEVIIQRREDGKYFRGYYVNFGRGIYDYLDFSFTEVFANNKLQIIYT